MKNRNPYLILVAIVLLLSALACSLAGTATPTETPTESPTEEVTVTDAPTEEAVPTPTNTPAPDVSGPGDCTLNASWVADVTVPDNTEFAPGATFNKVWRVRNSGTCTWEVGTQLVFVSGEPLGGPAAVAVPVVVPGSNTDIGVDLVAPATPGTYRSTWQLQAPDGARFGSQIYVQIVVPEPATPTEEPTEEPTAEPTATPTEETAAPPTPFGGGSGKIAYVSFRDGNAEIYVMGDNDAAPIRLTDNPEIDDWPDWSPDGARIVFTRYTGSKPDIYVMNADGTFQINLTNNPAWDSGPAWSPDGARIAFDSNRAGNVLQIWIMKTDGTGLIQLTNTPQLNSSPDWSPDGNRIVFESNRDGQREIYIMNSDGTAQTRLTFSSNNYGPEWSPNGKRIVFSSSDGLWSIKPDGTQLTQLTINAGPFMFDMHPHWSPDGTQIVFDTKRSGNQDLYVIKADGTGMQQLTTNTAQDANPTWR